MIFIYVLVASSAKIVIFNQITTKIREILRKYWQIICQFKNIAYLCNQLIENRTLGKAKPLSSSFKDITYLGIGVCHITHPGIEHFGSALSFFIGIALAHREMRSL